MKCGYKDCNNKGKSLGKNRNRAKYCKVHYRIPKKCDYCKDPIGKGRKKWCIKCAFWWRKVENKSLKAKKRKLAWYHKNKQLIMNK